MFYRVFNSTLLAPTFLCEIWKLLGIPRSSVEQELASKFQVQENLMILYHNEHF